MTRIKTALFVIALFFAQTVSAQVLISEVMYDPKGSDTGREWVEIYNNSDYSVDLTKWKFSDGSNHVLNVPPKNGGKGSIVVESGKCVIFASDATQFISEHPDYRSTVIDTVMSLGQQDKTYTVQLIKEDQTGGDSMEYQVSLGANDDGNSLQKINGLWGGVIPTPGCSSNDVVNENQSATENITIITTSPQAATPSYPVEPQIFTDAGPVALTVSTGATVTFVGKAWGFKKEPLENSRMVWTFGDGGTGEGTSVAHTFYYPGEYTVVLDTASGYYSASDRIRVTAVTPAVVVRAGGDISRSFVVLQNNGNDELDLSLWQIEVSGKKFIIPKNTFVAAKKTLTFASEVTGLVAPVGSLARLNFPNGTQVRTVNSLVTNTLAPQVVKNAETKTVSVVAPKQKVAALQNNQEAAVVDAFDSSTPSTRQNDDGLWLWYSSAALLGVVALLGLRFIQKKGETKTTFTADDFRIIDDTEVVPDDFDENEPH